MNRLCKIWLLRLIRCSKIILSVSTVCVINACTLDDYRDLCCAGNTSMRYTYLPYGHEQFTDYIYSLHHYLFDASGVYIRELNPGENLQNQPLLLNEGHYTMITIGNLSEKTKLQHMGNPNLEVFTLSSCQQYPYSDSSGSGATDLDNGDELYWGIKSFMVDLDGLATGIERENEDYVAGMVTHMNNIHCHLRVKVEWSNIPPYTGDYEMELDGVPSGYSLHPNLATNADGFIVPQGIDYTSHKIRVPLKARELNGEFITLRISDDHIPILRILFNDRKVAPDIDLYKAFLIWGWHPSRIHVQKYAIRILIKSDGSADLFPSFDSSIDDWIDGGSFG